MSVGITSGNWPSLAGRRVHLSEHLMMDDDEHVTASYVRPLWRRLLRGRIADPVPMTVRVPSDQAYILPDGTMVMHPARWHDLAHDSEAP